MQASLVVLELSKDRGIVEQFFNQKKCTQCAGFVLGCLSTARWLSQEGVGVTWGRNFQWISTSVLTVECPEASQAVLTTGLYGTVCAVERGQRNECVQRQRDSRQTVSSRPNVDCDCQSKHCGIVGPSCDYPKNCGRESCGEIRSEAAETEQKQLRIEVLQDILDATNLDHDFMNTIILVTSLGYGSENLKTAEQTSTMNRVLDGLRFGRWLPSFGTERAYCCATFCVGVQQSIPSGIVRPLRRAIQNKRRGMLTKGVRFHHDNARPHTARQTTALIEEFGWELVSHPPYSPDVAPSDFLLFPELKKNLGGTQFQDDYELEEAVLGFLCGQAAEFFDSGLHKWVSRMQKCVERNGEYV
ncbi:hypothetical protein LAZ67_X004295 [Cordylochernes scorpioides]|uniref:Histone-lysine N-methyltransferase SETMAR n=1 Tax=Cordylochernes scorpioides TaxID=51811 RepID=A0ABY6LZP3_9ARAC|nr:hypothetical protein LAZ67_X004295 [Cordylochernes scorpioides]